MFHPARPDSIWSEHNCTHCTYVNRKQHTKENGHFSSRLISHSHVELAHCSPKGNSKLKGVVFQVSIVTT